MNNLPLNVEIITAPVIEPISLISLKLHLRIDSGSFEDNIDENQLIIPGSHAVSTVYTQVELMTLDVAPGGAGWAVGDTITGNSSSKTCVIVEKFSTTSYSVWARSGTYTLGEILTNGVDTADQGADYPTFAGKSVDVLGYTALAVLDSGISLATSTNDVKIQESDDNITFTDWTGGAFTQVTTANDSAVQEIAYTGTKQYIRALSKVLVAACSFGVSVVRLTATSIEDDLLDADIEAARERVEDETRRVLLTQTWDMHLDGWPADNFITLPFGNLQSVTYIKYTESDGTITNLTKTITAFANSGTSPGTKTKVTSAAHGYSTGNTVYISGTTSYDGGWEISNVTTNTFDITIVFVADDATGQASTFYIVETNGDRFGRIVLPYSTPWPSFTAYPSNPIVIRFICGWTTAALVPSKIKQAVKLYCGDLYVNRESQVIIIPNEAFSENKTAENLLNSSRLWM